MGAGLPEVARSEIERLARRRAEELEAERAHSVLVRDRQRLAADLHDLVIQRLYACQLQLNAIAAKDGSEVDPVIDELDEAIRELRTVIYEIKCSDDTTPLIENIRLLLDTHQHTHTASLTVRGPAEQIRADVGQHLLAVVREALSNAVRHADATAIAVTIAIEPHELVLTVADDGTGITEIGRSSGLANMEQRAAKLGGTFTVDGAGPGTTLIWRVPQ